MRSVVRAHIALFLANAIYGGNYTFAKEVIPHHIGPFGLIVIRAISAAILFWIFHSLVIKESIKSVRDYFYLALCAVFGVAINQLLFFKGLSITTPINASLLMTSTPILVLIIAHFYLEERLTLLKILGVLAGGVGAAGLILVGGEDFNFGSDTLWGDFLVFINASAYGLYLVLVRPMMHKYHPLTVIKWVFTFGIFFVTPVGFGELTVVDWGSLSGYIWFCVAYVVLMTTFTAYLLNAWALRKVTSSIAGIYIYLQPVLATLIAIGLGKDQLTLPKIIYAVLIFAGVYLVSKRSPKRGTNK